MEKELKVSELKDVKLLKFNVINLNKRFYQADEFQKKKIIEDNECTLLEKLNSEDYPLFGELGYPENFMTNMSRVSHQVSNIRIVDNCLIGDVKILNTTTGKSLADTLSVDKNSIVFRPRSSGSVREDGSVKVDYVYSFDAVLADNDAYKGLI